VSGRGDLQGWVHYTLWGMEGCPHPTPGSIGGLCVGELGTRRCFHHFVCLFCGFLWFPSQKFFPFFPSLVSVRCCVFRPHGRVTLKQMAGGRLARVLEEPCWLRGGTPTRGIRSRALLIGSALSLKFNQPTASYILPSTLATTQEVSVCTKTEG